AVKSKELLSSTIKLCWGIDQAGMKLSSESPQEHSGLNYCEMEELCKDRYVSVRDFKGKVLIDIREYWMNQDGEMKPGKKDISLSPEQWNQLKDQISEIDDVIKRV
uniref:Activated RNA polymerase II transcriptional coactivator p15 n=1 Tax=Amphiprion percula TaxID=161767 RepID=A0A3P8T583_AMPPE